MAFLARYAGVTPAEFDELEPKLTVAFAKKVAALRSAEIDLEMNLARLAAGARIGGGRAEELR
jgi:hypothetical protein